ncbi:MAG TPA: hypothetical protein VHS31_03875 [Tepidisphaeraceae bacterium]|nr:hypothetical protein [Tepidisphaeraceae bacterium]
MELNDIQQALLKQNLRITPAMGSYILQRLQSQDAGEISIIAGNARTGVPLRATVLPAQLLEFTSDPVAPSPTPL